MTISAALRAALATLTAALDNDGASIEQSLDQLDADASATVPGYRGLSIVVRQSNTPIEISLMPEPLEPGEIRSSLLLTLPRTAGGSEGPPMDLIFYSSAPGGLVDLAADLAWLLDRSLTEITMDSHLDPPVTQGHSALLQSSSDVDQALGVLIGRGYAPAEGLIRLQEKAEAEQTDLHGAALRILAEVTGDSEDPSPPQM